MTTNLERASLVSHHVQIDSVILTDTRMKATLHTIAEPTKLRLGNWFRCSHELRPTDPDRVFVHIDLKFEANPGGEADVEGGALIELSAIFLATYRLEGASAYPRDALQHFAELNGTYNVWPYWRELVQSFAGRAGLPDIVVPVFKPRVREIATQEELGVSTEAPVEAENVLARTASSGSTSSIKS